MGKLWAWIRSNWYYLTGLYLFVFLAGFFLVEQIVTEPVYVIHSTVDDWIPFNEWFVLPYFLWYIWIPLFMIILMFHDRAAYLRLCFVMFVGATACLIIYVIWPNGLDLRQPIEGENFCADIVRFLRQADSPYNVCPSLHVSSTVAVHLAVCRSRLYGNRPWVKFLSLSVTVLICMSTVFVKQHSVIDVICGWLLSQGLNLAADRISRRASDGSGFLGTAEYLSTESADNS